MLLELRHRCRVTEQKVIRHRTPDESRKALSLVRAHRDAVHGDQLPAPHVPADHCVDFTLRFSRDALADVRNHSTGFRYQHRTQPPQAWRMDASRWTDNLNRLPAALRIVAVMSDRCYPAKNVLRYSCADTQRTGNLLDGGDRRSMFRVNIGPPLDVVAVRTAL